MLSEMKDFFPLQLNEYSKSLYVFMSSACEVILSGLFHNSLGKTLKIFLRQQLNVSFSSTVGEICTANSLFSEFHLKTVLVPPDQKGLMPKSCSVLLKAENGFLCNMYKEQGNLLN